MKKRRGKERKAIERAAIASVRKNRRKYSMSMIVAFSTLLVIVAGLLFLYIRQRADYVPMDSVPHLTKFMENYYTDPRSHKVIFVLEAMRAHGMLENEAFWPTFIGWMSGLFCRYPDKASLWIPDVNPVAFIHWTAENTNWIYGGLQHCNIKEIRQMKRQLSKDFGKSSVDNFKIISKMLAPENDPPAILNERPYKDLIFQLFGQYFATGDPLVLRRLIMIADMTLDKKSIKEFGLDDDDIDAIKQAQTDLERYMISHQKIRQGVLDAAQKHPSSEALGKLISPYVQDPSVS